MNELADANYIARRDGINALRVLIDHAERWTTPHLGRNNSGGKVPHPLPSSLLPVAPFEFDLMPSQLRPWVADVCERMQCPPDYVAVSVMAAAGAVIGRKVLLRPLLEDDWAIVANQWALCIGRPGVMKSPAMEEALRPIKQLSAAAQQRFAADTCLMHGANALSRRFYR